MNFMDLTGTSISQFFPTLATSYFLCSKIGHIPIPRRRRVLTFKFVQAFGRGLWGPIPVSDSI